jgi:hypothetical protein
LTEGLPTEEDQLDDPEEQQAIAEQMTKKKSKVLPFTPEFSQQRWKGPDDNSWVQADKLSSSRHGPDYIDTVNPDNALGQVVGPFGMLIGKKKMTAKAVIRQSGSIQRGANLGLGPLSGGVGKSNGVSWIDYMDMNGDRFPDVVRKGKVQFTHMTGGLENSHREVGLAFFFRKSHSQSMNIGIGGGSFPWAKDSARGTNNEGTKKPNAAFWYFWGI